MLSGELYACGGSGCGSTEPWDGLVDAGWVASGMTFCGRLWVVCSLKMAVVGSIERFVPGWMVAIPRMRERMFWKNWMRVI